jgi:hypothetical protein
MADDSLKARTDAKLRYARIHLEELKAQLSIRGDDFERSHQEAFLAQLFGAYAALLQELNIDLDCNLASDDVTLGKMCRALECRGCTSPQLVELYELEINAASWFSQAKCMRNHTTHVGGIPLAFYVKIGGEEDRPRPTSLLDPRNREELPGDATDVLASWLSEMESLIRRVREGASTVNKSC